MREERLKKLQPSYFGGNKGAKNGAEKNEAPKTQAPKNEAPKVDAPKAVTADVKPEQVAKQNGKK